MNLNTTESKRSMQNLSDKWCDQVVDFNDSGFSEWEKLFACDDFGEFSSPEHNFSPKTVDASDNSNLLPNVRAEISCQDDVINSQKLSMSSEEVNSLSYADSVGYEPYRISHCQSLSKLTAVNIAHKTYQNMAVLKRGDISPFPNTQLLQNQDSECFPNISNQRSEKLFAENKDSQYSVQEAVNNALKGCIQKKFAKNQISILNPNSRSQINTNIRRDISECELPISSSQESESTMPFSQESSRSESTMPFSQESARNESIASSQESFRCHTMTVPNQESSPSYTMIVSSQESRTMIVSSQEGSENQEMIVTNEETNQAMTSLNQGDSDCQSMIISSQGSSERMIISSQGSSERMIISSQGSSERMFISSQAHCDKTKSFCNKESNSKRNQFSNDDTSVELHNFLQLRSAKKLKLKQSVTNPVNGGFKGIGYCKKCKNFYKHKILSIRRKELMITKRENAVKNREKQLAARETDVLKREKILKRQYLSITGKYLTTPKKISVFRRNSILYSDQY